MHTYVELGYRYATAFAYFSVWMAIINAYKKEPTWMPALDSREEIKNSFYYECISKNYF